MIVNCRIAACAITLLSIVAPAAAQQFFVPTQAVVTGGIASSDGAGNTVYTFIGTGTFTTSKPIAVNALVCAGSGGGASGGGAGNCITNASLNIPAGSTPITVGQGGFGALAGNTTPGGNGASSSIGGLLVAAAPAGGNGINQANGVAGASGGGCGATSTITCTGGTASQGFAGGSVTTTTAPFPAAGGGGSLGLGGSVAGSAAGSGGLGITSSIIGGSFGYGGGGGGGVFNPGVFGIGQSGGGSGAAGAFNGFPGRPNSGGGGGGGGGTGVGGNGSVGVVIISCPTAICGPANGPIAPYLGQVATRSYMFGQIIASTTGWNSRACHYATDNITSLQFEDVNWYIITRVGETNQGGTKTITRSVEYPVGTSTFNGTGSGTNLAVGTVGGTIHTNATSAGGVGDTLAGTGIPAETTVVSQTSGTTGGAGVYVTSNPTTASNNALTSVALTPVKWSGAASVAIADGSSALSDAVSVTIPYGAQFVERMYQVNQVGVMQAETSRKVNAICGDAVNNSNVDQTMSGASVTNTAGNFPITAQAIVGTTTRPTIGTLGSSRMVGAGDALGLDAGGNQGYTRMFGRLFGYIDTSVVGDTLVVISGSGGAKRRALIAAYASHLWMDPGLNDFNFNSATPATVEGYITSMVSSWGGGLGKVIINDEAAWTTSTDGWTTSANQTVTSFEANRVSLNTWIDALTGFNQVVMPNQFDGNGVNFNIWNNPAVGGSQFTADGIHENTATDRAMAASGIFNPNLLFH